MDSPSPRIRAAVAFALGAYRGRVARKMLQQLADDPDDTVRAEAQDSLHKFQGR
jgi:HEAT repeat protein